MTYTLENLIESLRHPERAGSLATADFYLKSLAAAGDLFGQNAGQWTKELASAAARLTHSDAGMLIKGYSNSPSADDGSILDFNAFVTTKSKDRDNDIVEPKGLTLDTNMPLLWQHIQLQPIGRIKSLLEQTDDYVHCKFGIADTALGRDAAVLVKFNALRMSHGFKPTDFEPREIVKGRDGKDYVKGWHIKAANVHEASLVSVPANADAVITAYSRKSLESDIVKSWAKQFYDARPVQVPGYTLRTKAGEMEATGFKSAGEMAEFASVAVKGSATGAVAEPGNASQKPKCPKCTDGVFDSTGTCSSCGHIDTAKADGKAASDPLATKTAAEKVTTEKAAATPAAPLETVASLNTKAIAELSTKSLHGAMDYFMPGSWEWVQEKLQRTARAYLTAKEVDVDENDYYVSLVATYADRAIICLNRYGYGKKSRRCYQVSWEMKDSEPVWSGEPAEVSIEPQVVAKSIRADELTPAELGNRLTAKACAGDEDAIAAIDQAGGMTAHLKLQKSSRAFEELLNIN